MLNCPKCNQAMKALFISLYCPNCENANANINTFSYYIPVWKIPFSLSKKNMESFPVPHKIIFSSQEEARNYLITNNFLTANKTSLLIIKITSNKLLSLEGNKTYDITFNVAEKDILLYQESFEVD